MYEGGKKRVEGVDGDALKKRMREGEVTTIRQVNFL